MINLHGYYEGGGFMDNLTPAQRHKNMQNIKGKDTSIEIKLRKALWAKGYRYRKNYKELPGKPDIVLTKQRIAIFCDSEFFHGKDWEILKPRLEKSKNSEYWQKKITRNMERDEEVNKQLMFLGWTVIRFWGKDILKDTDECIKVIEETKKFISKKINDEGKRKLEFLEEEINKDYVYAKDIELLKRMLIFNNENVNEEYDENNQIKTLFIEVPEEIGFAYVKAEKGTVEYHQHIKSYIPRMKRLIKNLDKYIIEEEKGTFKINQSIAIQDSVNMAVALFNDMEFRAVSGKNDIENSCTLIPLGQDYFKSCKVNKLGKLGIGYNRVNDSEKKIIEEIHKLITKGKLKAEGDFTLYSKWEPCPSCYYVISQFIEKYPKINLKVMYYKEYGEK